MSTCHPNLLLPAVCARVRSFPAELLRFPKCVTKVTLDTIITAGLAQFITVLDYLHSKLHCGFIRFKKQIPWVSENTYQQNEVPPKRTS